MATRNYTKFIIIHSSATRPSMDIGADTIRGWHRQRGFKDIGYHMVIRRSGEVEPGRPLSEIGAHVKGKNDISVGVCLIGGVNEDKSTKAENNFTDAQWESLKAVIRNLKEQYPDAQVVGHRDLAATECPSFNVQEWCKDNDIC